MVAHHSKYTAAKENDQDSGSWKRADRISQSVLAHFGLDTLDKYEGFISDANVDPEFQGEEVSLYNVLKHLIA